jgi:hypothetical protein
MSATLKFLNYESMIKMEIKDEYFNEIQIPSLSLGFVSSEFITKKKLFETFNNKFERNSNLSIFQKLYDEFKILKIFECKIKFKGILEDCDKYIDPLFNIYGVWRRAEICYDFIKSYDGINGSLINGLKVNDFGFSIVYMTTNKNENRLEMKRKYFPTFLNLRQQEFLRITTNSNEYHFQLYLNINKDFEERDLSLTYHFFKIKFMEQKNFMVIKKSFRFLEFPYQSKCSYYNSDKTLFNSSSHKHCVRQCIRFNCEIKINCSCFTIKNTVNQMDYGFQNLSPCQMDNYKYKLISHNFKILCENLCPNDCIQDEYIIIERDNTLSINANFKLTLNWDESKPFITNIETPVMTFKAYIYYIGGLFGMWFGINANQLFIKLIENFSNYFRAIINFFIILFYTLIEIAIFIKAKLQSNI